MPRQIALPPDWGDAWLWEKGEHQSRCAATTRSYDHTGTQLVWAPGPVAENAVRFACDIEHLGRDVDAVSHLLRCDTEDFVQRWVVSETLAKLCNVPILHWLRQYGLQVVDGIGINSLSVSAREGSSGMKTSILVIDLGTTSRVLALGYLLRDVQGTPH